MKNKRQNTFFLFSPERITLYSQSKYSNSLKSESNLPNSFDKQKGKWYFRPVILHFFQKQKQKK
ncbi:MAG: hypothetical protein CVU11_11885 [Bacteroidetes bacterium HGW-Bacteroidetes-6]|jgi:hypothetical protein|nr:MAG: hypothetical protein CVU11_11885 [Bacteroidetes bacterium HGW-Bacteroidetes-6]